MCGICGTIGNLQAQARLQQAMTRMAHRGPDQHASHVTAAAALGHQRLSILDLSDQGRQPMTNEDGTLWLVFNGEIYNFAALRSQLAPNHHFRSHTDSEVLIHGYEEWGIEGLIRRIRGMFAFALWDETTATLHLVRDHLGKKPLFYTTLGGGLAFASTLPTLIDLLGTTPPVSHTAVLDYLTYLCVPSPSSIFEGVHKLPPAHRLEFRLGAAPQVVRYWQPDFRTQIVQSEEDWVAQIEDTLTEAVRDRLVADVPVGAFLSGGVDSSLVVAIMARLSDRPITTISVGFDQTALNELPYAQRVAEVCGTDHHPQVLAPDAAALLPSLVFHYGEPFADHSALPTYAVAKAARDRLKVVLTGDGGDETFAGYQHILAMRVAQQINRLPNGLKSALADRLRQLEQRGHRRVRKFRWVAELAQGSQGNYVFDPVGGRTARFSRAALLGPALQTVAATHHSDALYQAVWAAAAGPTWCDRALETDLLTHLPDALLTKVDVATMAHGLEARSPLLDLRLVELSCQIPAALKLRGWHSKALLKRLAAKYLPPEVLYRRKQGFSLPTSTWLRGELGTVLGTVLLSSAARSRGYVNPDVVSQWITHHQQGIADHGQRLWALLMLELWCQMFVDKTLSPTDSLATITPFPSDRVLVSSWIV